MTPSSNVQLQRLQAIIESSHDAIIGCRLDGVITSWNPAARRLYGHRGDEAIGQSLDLLTDGDQAGELPRMLERLVTGERFEHYETVHCRRDGSPLAVSISISLLDLPGEGVGEASLIVRDITATRSTEAELRQTHRELETLVGTAAHELRAPIFGARELAAMVRQEMTAPSDDLLAFLGHLEGSLHYSRHLLDQLTAIAGARLAERRHGPVDSREVVEKLLLELRKEEPAHTQSFDVAVGLPRLWCSADALSQVLRQLLLNAVQFAGPEASIEVGWRPAEAPLVTLFVRDDGPGIPRGEQTRVFDMFYRRHGPGRQGPGLGLALVQRLCEAMGGRAWLESTVGGGSTFFVALPSDEGR